MIERYSRSDMKAIWSEQGKYDRWLLVEIAVCEAWAKIGVIPQNEIELLRGATWDLKVMSQAFQKTRHDMTAFLQSMTVGLGPEGRWIHLGLTSNDVWDTATGLQLRDAGQLLIQGIEKLLIAISNRALEHQHTLIIGRTHGVHAEPTTFGLKLALWWDEMRRNHHRLKEALSQVSVGKISGAVGTHATVPLEVEVNACEILGLEPALLSNQIIQRDRHAYFITTLAVIAASLEKFATEIRSLQRTEVAEVQEPFGDSQTGSSAMPHKRNPELSERVCGLARLVRGYAITALENVALWHERDISHSSAERLVLPDSCLILDYILDLFRGVVDGLKVFPTRMLANIDSTHGLIFSQRVMLALIEKGMLRDSAYKLAQNYATVVWDDGGNFKDLIQADPTVRKHLTDDEIEELFDYGYFVRNVDQLFDRVGLTNAREKFSDMGDKHAPA